ncbi:MAG: hypothetical protein EP329_09050 [Deltaproteobacteria bacterium]|nr:MAG: hypothetical protein EP329_09050 [Deltaproteobacteria bacterium]
MTKPLSLLLLVLVAACSDPAGSRVDASVDTSDDALQSAADTVDGDDALADAAIDAGDDAAPNDTGLGPAPDPEERPTALAWAIQSDQSSGASVGWPAVAGLPDGGVVVVATFDGTVTFGGREIVASDERYAHALLTRVTPDGDVAALTWLCDRCIGYGTAPVLPLADGNLALASVVDGEVVLAPGTAGEQRLTTDGPQLLVAVLTPDGAPVRARLVASTPHSGEVRALAETADGGVVIAGNAQALAVPDGPAFPEEEGWGYPGRAFVLGVDGALDVRFAEQLGGAAGSTINQVRVVGDALFAVGDFGGYPLGVASVFGAGTAEEAALESVSSDDDPAMDIFVARWDVGAVAEGRPRFAWARRIAHYSNGPRPATFIRGDGADGIELRIDGADGVEPDDAGELRTVPAYGSHGYLVARVSRDGDVSAALDVPSPIVPAPGGFMSVASWWSGSVVEPAGDAGPSFPIPESTSGADGVNWSGVVLGSWRADGALVAAGLLLQRLPGSYYPLSLQAAVPQADGAAILVLHGSAPLTLVPSAGEAVELTREPGYERLVVVRARLE